jgi:hypothetical protein
MATEFEKASPEKQRAVRDYVGQFQSVPSEWARLAAVEIDKDDCIGMPMWGTVFLVSGLDAHPIEKLLRHPVPEDAVGLIEFIEQHGISIEEPEMKLLALAASDDDADAEEIERIRHEIIDQWRESGSEDASLADSGWQDVGSTGVIAREIDETWCSASTAPVTTSTRPTGSRSMTRWATSGTNATRRPRLPSPGGRR